MGLTENRYDAVYRDSIERPEEFWGKIAAQFDWYEKPTQILDNSDSVFTRWFVGGKTNICYNALDRHLKNGLGDKPALIWEGAAQGFTRIITYRELYSQVNRLAAVFRSFGVEKGDRIVFYMPTVPEAVMVMLAATRLGAIHAGIFTGYGLENITERILSARPKIIVTADGSFRRNRVVPLKETLDIALQKAPVETVIVLNRGVTPVNMVNGRDYDWETSMRERGADYVEPLPVESSHPSHILFTSGDTENPRGVVNDTGGYMVGVANSMPMIYGVRPDDVFWPTSDIGWRVGASYTCWGPLLYGVTSIMFEGTPDYPDHAVYWRLMEKHKVNVVFSITTVFRMLERFGIEHARQHDISSLRLLFLAGEYVNPEIVKWSTEAINGKPVIDHYWLTEAGWPMTSIMAGVGMLPIKPGVANKPVIGWQLAVVDKNGNDLPAGKEGYLVAKSPLPPGHITTLWQNRDFYAQDYWHFFPGKTLFLCGDYATQDEDGYLKIGARVDEVINVAGQRISTREIAHVISLHPGVQEVCVVGAADALKGDEPVGLVVLRPGVESSAPLKNELRNLVRDQVGAIAAPKDIRFVPSIPKNAQGKHLRNVIKAVLDKQAITDYSTLKEDASPDEIKAAFELMKTVLG